MSETGITQDEIIYWTDSQTGDVWERTGYCSQCGDCCDDDPIDHLFKNQDGNWVQGNGLNPVVHGKCAYFRLTQDGKGFCTGRDTIYYNTGCKFQPSKPNHIVNWPNCTYKFTKISSGNAN